MAKKKNKNNNNNAANNGEGEKKENKEESPKKEEAAATEGGGGGGGEEKKEKKKEKDNNIISVVLKIEMHCDGCASKITKLARSLDGVESAKADSGSNKLTVVGQVDPLQIRDILHDKTHKKVDLISPQPKKEKEDNTNKPNNNNNNNNNKNQTKDDKSKKPDADKKPKETPVTAAVLKLSLHCQGCIEKIHRIVSKTKGVHEMTLDKQKETVTVKGTMDVKALTEALKDRLKRPVEVVPPKKEKEGNGGEKDGENGGGKKKGGGGGGNQGNAGGGDGGAGPKVEGNKMEYVVQPGYGPGYGIVGQPVYPYELVGRPVYPEGYVPGRPVYPYGYDYGYGSYGPPQGYYIDHMRFNDENPHACSIM
ncbi:hypothetical protein Tsubulata_007492 [Turnera subulata]|uniref:HMA domain-containing protein n=1 Tax=Turnera subulata TaxID=218843 RepID=A0A9Q0FF71_9ROSI|nr:hypothetical protein Tsubulata_007492 [Turnera subulata]